MPPPPKNEVFYLKNGKPVIFEIREYEPIIKDKLWKIWLLQRTRPTLSFSHCTQTHAETARGAKELQRLQVW